MAGTYEEAIDDEEIARSVRTITRQRANKRLAAIAGLLIALFGLAGAVWLSYSDANESAESP